MSDTNLKHDVRRTGKAKMSFDSLALKPAYVADDERSAEPGDFIGHAGALALFLARDVASISEIWRTFQRTALYTPFQDIDWIQSWLKAAKLKPGYRPFVVLGYDKNELCFILPLAVVQTHGFVRLCWLGQPINDYNAPLLDPGFAERCDQALIESIWYAVYQACGHVDVQDLKRQPAGIAGAVNPFVGQDAIASSCDAHLINLRPGWKDFYKDLRNSRSRKRLRDKKKRLSSLGRTQFRCEKDASAKRRLIRKAVKWKWEQLNASGAHHPFAPDTRVAGEGSVVERTLVGLSELPHAEHKLRVEGLYVAGEPVAVAVVMTTGDRYSVFITAHANDKTSKLSPGKILLVETLQLACRAGYSKYDLLAGDEEYKLHWCDERIGLWDQVRGLTFKGRCIRPIVIAARLSKKKLKQNPGVLQVLKELNKLRLMQW